MENYSTSGRVTLWIIILAVILFAFIFYVVPYIERDYQNINNGNMILKSSAFEEGGMIPKKYTCDADNPVSPPLEISGVPEGASSLVLVMDDPDIPDFVKESRGIEVFDHWVLYGISPDTKEIAEGEAFGAEGLNSAGETGYRGPCPPDGEHRYFFKLYAISGTLNFINTPSKDEVLQAIESMTLDEAILMGRYKRENQ